MKGILFNAAEEAVRQEFGDDTWDRLLDHAGAEGVYTSLGNYSDQEMYDLVAAAADLLGQSQADTLVWLGRQAIPQFYALYPELFDPHPGARSFLLTLNDVIHPEVRKLYPGVDVPEFDFDDPEAEPMPLGYRSRRQMCSLAEGLILGSGEHYGEALAVGHRSCMHQGADRCLLEVHFGAG
ncbi:MAG: heme NO-binding domain-containing protein [Thiohalorhabdaceae bacterium]